MVVREAERRDEYGVISEDSQDASVFARRNGIPVFVPGVEAEDKSPH